MSTQPHTFVTPEEYLEIERRAECKSEYYQGEMYAMARAGWIHNLIAANTVAQLINGLRSKPCAATPSDMRVHIPATGLYTYPDVVVVCGEPQFLDGRRDTVVNPTLLVEILSPSTEAYDRGRKAEHYRSISSLQAYLLISSDRVHVDLYTRQPAEQWLLTSAGSPGDSLDLDAVGYRLSLAELYDKVDFSTPDPPANP